MVRELLRNAMRLGWPLGVWLLMAPSLGALSDCRADRPPPTPTATPAPPRATATVPSQAPPSPTPYVSIPAGTATVAIGDARIGSGQRALVPITVTNIPTSRGLGGYTVRINFDPAVVHLVSVAGGDPPFNGAPVSNINNTEGWVVVVGLQVATLNGPRGPITVANLEVEAVDAWTGATTLGLHVTELFDTYADPIAATEVHGWVRVP